MTAPAFHVGLRIRLQQNGTAVSSYSSFACIYNRLYYRVAVLSKRFNVWSATRRICACVQQRRGKMYRNSELQSRMLTWTPHLLRPVSIHEVRLPLRCDHCEEVVLETAGVRKSTVSVAVDERKHCGERGAPEPAATVNGRVVSLRQKGKMLMTCSINQTSTDQEYLTSAFYAISDRCLAIVRPSICSSSRYTFSPLCLF